MVSSEAAGTVVSVCMMVLLLNSATGTTCDNLHSNLLENLSCEAVDQESDVTKPSVILRWEWPTLTGNRSETGFSIEVVYEASMTQNTITISNATRSDKNTTVPLDRDDEYSFSVYIVCDNASRPATPTASCKVNTYSRRTIGRLSLSCPSTASSSGEARILVSWLSPYGVGVRTVDSWSKCLYNGNTSNQSRLLLGNSIPDGTSLLNFTALPGTVCLFGAKYLPDDFSFRTKRIPPESCGVPAVQPTGRAQLRVTCSESMAAVDVVTPGEVDTVNSSQLQGWCITPDWVPYPPLESAQRYLEPGQSSIGDLPDGTICSFYGNYTLQSSDVEYTFEPAQCIVNQPIPSPETSSSIPRPVTAPPISISPPTSDDSPTANTPPPTTAPPTASTPPPTTAPSTASTPPTNDASATKTQTEAPASGFNVGSPVITAVVVAVTLVTTSLVCMIAACLIVKKSSLRTRREQKMQMWLDKTEGPEDIDEDPCVLPQFPYTSHVLDTMSITTEVDYLYKEEGRAVVSKDSLSSLMKAMENDEKIVDSPKLIMDRFLNGCHERVWECSHESLTAPHELSSIQLTEPYEHMNLNTAHSASTNKDFHLDLPPRCHCTNDRSTIERDCVRHTDSHSGCYVPTKDCYTDDEGYIHFNRETTV